ncbi:hypothetical protein Glove_106g34 [Diversispora epigaea]|uniref:Uncharacterized protein n=1 Tax=Diversispora epigaea TaxID=1348612 RepID=A0A397J2Z2_9GLOM|nr:hypothetical protein Glove_106g34 [Diversispora epigaea]
MNGILEDSGCIIPAAQIQNPNAKIPKAEIPNLKSQILVICTFWRPKSQIIWDLGNMYRMYLRTIQESTISGKEPFLGEMLKPFSENISLSADEILDLIVAYSSVNFFKRKPSKSFTPITFEYLQYKRNIYEGY